MPPSPKRQKKGGFRVAYQGADGAFSQIAAQNFYKNSIKSRTCGTSSPKAPGDLSTVGMDTFQDVFEAVSKNKVVAGVLPLENSVSGTLKEILSLLVQYEDVFITAETCEIEKLCLCANKGATLDTITEVHSDATHLDQCSLFLSSLKGKVQRCVDWDSAGSCKVVKESGSKTCAAIASNAAAEANGMEVLQANASNLGGLATRYIVISKDEATVAPGVQAKCSVVALLRNEPMALMKLVSAFALRGMNITKLESQPACHVRNDMFSGRHFDYLFFVDFEPKDEGTTPKLLENVQEFAQSVRLLGRFPKAVALEDVSHTDMPWTAYM